MTNLIDRNRVRFGPYQVDLHTREIWKFGTRMKLVGQPFEILAVLVTRAGELVTREELRERLWRAETFVDFNHGLNAAVNKLRDTLCDSAEDPKFIETLPRRGYRFIAKVERDEPVAAARSEETNALELASAEVVVSGPPESRVAPAEVRTTARGRRSWPLWALAGVVGGVLLFAVAISILKLSNAWAQNIRNRGDQSVALTGPIKGAQVVLLTGGRNEGPQYSPDGKNLVFMSNRVGAGEQDQLWVSDARGQDPRQLTPTVVAGTPRWSPDGTKIAFDSEIDGRAVVMLIDAKGGSPLTVASNDSNNRVPNWSRDGKYVYFGSDRTGRYEVWKMPARGGLALQITGQGGFAAWESADGKVLYYAKNEFERPEIWTVPVNGGEEKLASTVLRPGTWASWSIVGNSIYFVEEGAGNVAMLSRFDLQTQQLRQLTLLGRFPFWLGVSPDGKKVAFDRADSDTTKSIVELEDFQ